MIKITHTMATEDHSLKNKVNYNESVAKNNLSNRLNKNI